MADPITWGLLNLIKKRVKGVQTTLDGVSDKVSSLPDSIDTDFTEVKEAIVEVKTDVGNVNAAVSDVKSDTSSIKSTVDTNPLLSAGSVVKSIQRGEVYKKDVGVSNYCEIPISSVNLEKSVLLVSWASIDGLSSWEQILTISLQSNKIVMRINGQSSISPVFTLSWEVIEFY